MTYEDTDQVLYYRGRDRMKQGDLRGAIACFEESAALVTHAKTYELLGECWLLKKDYQRAVASLAASAGLGNRPTRALYLLSQALLARGEKDMAVEKLSLVLKMNPNYAAARKLRESLVKGST
jgi:tetratricopeptide (TPR) repeat protein